MISDTMNSRFESDKGVHGLSGQVVGSPDDYDEFESINSGISHKKDFLPAVSATPLCRMRADSISAVESRCPETLITSIGELGKPRLNTYFNQIGSTCRQHVLLSKCNHPRLALRRPQYRRVRGKAARV